MTVAQSLHSSCLCLFLWHLVHQPEVETRQRDNFPSLPFSEKLG